MKMLLKKIWSVLAAEKTSAKNFRRMLGDEGYAVADQYIVYKSFRIAKFEVRGDEVWIRTHSKNRGYSRLHRVRNLKVALHKLRESYRNFSYAAEKPGTRLPAVRVARRVEPNNSRGSKMAYN